MTTLLEKITEDFKFLFDEERGLAEEVEYQREDVPFQSIPVIFKTVSEEDQIDANIYGDVCFVLIHEDDLYDYFERSPKKDDKIIRSLPLAVGQPERKEIWYLTGEFQRSSAGIWKCLAQKNIRLYPRWQQEVRQ